MKKFPVVFLFLLAVCASAFSARPQGHLFIIGGGDRPANLMRRFVDLAGKFRTGKIVIFTMASGVPLEVGPETVKEFRDLGAADAVFHQLSRAEALQSDSPKILDGAGGVFFSGGVQSRLTDVLLDTPLHQKLLELYGQGLVLGGTSAGAAVMSEVMITGDEKRTPDENLNWQTIEAGNVVTTRGFGFVTDAIMDQHFVTRRRHNRLISLVLENPRLLGVGIDESTAVLVRPDGRYEIVGAKQVIVYDARRARIGKTADNRLGAAGMTLHILLPGDVFDPAAGTVEGRGR